MFGAGWRFRPPWPYDHPRLSRPVSEPSDIIQHLAQCEGIEPSLAFQPGSRLPSGPITTLATLHLYLVPGGGADPHGH